MKKTVTGGFLALIGTLWALGISWYATQNLVNSWMHSRFWESLPELGLLAPMIAALAMLAAGLGLMICSLFTKD